ncbi:hypothetical protein WR25_27333 [Diploscapter pachys]|uniref:Uncharacterized protein n=1 Tax=Diploscapter pachys TaxID=2018661 RepID=A0A2A2KCW1_9BILA|nr:hypothetical protein WR25_27333 [Diploscapter pachys]
MTDNAITAHVLALAQVADVMEEGGQNHFVVVAFGHGELGCLGHVLDLGDGLADIVGAAMTLVQGEGVVDDPGRSWHCVGSCVAWSDAIAGQLEYRSRLAPR